jgi:hypothetical protein
MRNSREPGKAVGKERAMPDDGKISGLYERDFYAWGYEQAKAVRAAQSAFLDSGTNDLRASLSGLDWENLAEEIESASRKDRRELGNRIETTIEHLLKLEFSPADGPRAGWRDTVRRSRTEIRNLLKESPSLRGALPELIAEATDDAVDLAARSMADHGEPGADRIRGVRYTPDQILTDWWPDSPA